jgi:hypothetical protein
MNDAQLTKDAILQRLQELVQRLYFMSESDYPLEVVYVEAEALTDKKVRELAGALEEAGIETVDLSYFFRNMTKVADETDEASRQKAEGFQALQAYMEQHLDNIRVYRVGSIEITVLTLGAVTEGGYVGFRTTVVES